MSDLERITGLIDEIHDAALDGSLWPQALRRMMMLLQASTRALERSESKSAALGEVLERLSSAVLFVDRGGRLVHANEAAARTLAVSDVLNWSGGKPRPRDERAAAHLDAILASARRGQVPPGCCALSVLHRTQNGERMTVQILPLSAGGRRHLTGPCAAAIIVSQQTWDLPQRLQSAARLYAFTPAEARVVGELLNGCTVSGAARALGIKEATVKTHLQHVFDKTGTRRQVDLAQRVADCGRSFPSRGADAATKLSTGGLE